MKRSELTGRFLPLNSQDRFWAKVDKTGDCWLWTGMLNDQGYGLLRVGSVKGRAHRIAYELLVGPVPEGLVLDHLCRVRHCVNPAHLEPVSQRENVLRGVGLIAQQARRTHCVHGHPFDEANTRRARGQRQCRACDAARHRAKKTAA